MLDWAALPTLSAGGLLAIFVLSILRGWLKPKADLDRMERDRDHWREAHTTVTAALTVLSQQNTQLLDGSRTTVDLLRALTAATTQRDTT